MSNRVHRPGFLAPTPRAQAERMAKVRARRDPVVNAMYSCSQWKELRAQVLRAANYICASYRCTQRACIVDHKKPHRGEAYLFFDLANLQPLCKHHHDIKTARHDGGFGNVRRAVQPRTASTAAQVTQGPRSQGDKNSGGDSGFSGVRRTARLSSFLRTPPFQGNGLRGKPDGTPRGNLDANTARVTRLSTRNGAPGATTGPGAAATNHPAAPGVPVIRNREVNR